jgi:hypothetical protein
MVPWPLVLIATTLIGVGVAFVFNWRRWADRYAAWNRSTFGRMALWYGSSNGIRALGVFYVILGIVIYVVWLVSLAGGTAHEP